MRFEYTPSWSYTQGHALHTPKYVKTHSYYNGLKEEEKRKEKKRETSDSGDFLRNNASLSQ